MKLYFTIELEVEGEELDLEEFTSITESLTKALEDHEVTLIKLQGGDIEEIKQ